MRRRRRRLRPYTEYRVNEQRQVAVEDFQSMPGLGGGGAKEFKACTAQLPQLSPTVKQSSKQQKQTFALGDSEDCFDQIQWGL